MSKNELKVGDKVRGFDPQTGAKRYFGKIIRIEGIYAILEGFPYEGCCPLEDLEKQESDAETNTTESNVPDACGAN